MQPRIGMNQSLIWLHYHPTLLMTSHLYIQHLSAQLSEVLWLCLCLNCGVNDAIQPKEIIDFFLT